MASWANRSFTVIWKDENDAEIESSQGVCPVASSLVYLASGYLLGSIWVCSILATITKWLLLWLNKVWVSFSWSIVKLQCSISFKYIGKWFRDQIRSDQLLSRVWLFATPWIAARQASLSITNPRSSLRSRPLSQWCHPAISSSVILFSSCPQSLPASESFPMS